MFSTDTILQTQKSNPKLTQKDILEKISEYNIFTKYLGEFKIGYIYNSPLRDDANPSFGIFTSKKTGSLLYKDLSSDDCGNVFKFVKKLKNLGTYAEVYEEILSNFNTTLDNGLKNTHNPTKAKEKNITVTRKRFNLFDINFWNSFGITVETLKKYNVSAIAKYYVNNEERDTYRLENPIYCYKVFDKFKIYKPFGTKLFKWRSTLGELDIQGFEQLPMNGDLLVITKSLKDVMVLHEMGYNAIAPPSESVTIPEQVISNIRNRFKKIVLFYDRDKAGVMYSRKISRLYNLPAIFINKKYKTKDISDLVKNIGMQEAKNVFNQMIN